MGGRNGGFGVLISAAVGTLFLVPEHGLAQAQVFRQDPCSSAVVYTSAFAALIGCAAEGSLPTSTLWDGCTPMVSTYRRTTSRQSGGFGWLPSRDILEPSMTSD